MSSGYPSSRNSLPQTTVLQNVHSLTERQIVPAATLLSHTVPSWWAEQARPNRSQTRICKRPLNQSVHGLFFIKRNQDTGIHSPHSSITGESANKSQTRIQRQGMVPFTTSAHSFSLSTEEKMPQIFIEQFCMFSRRHN